MRHGQPDDQMLAHIVGAGAKTRKGNPTSLTVGDVNASLHHGSTLAMDLRGGGRPHGMLAPSY